jgi:hypothetical protein
LEITLQAGGRLAWIDQDYATTFNGANVGANSQREELELNLRGAGVRVGGEGRLYVVKWLAIYGKSFTSLLVAHREDISNLGEVDPTGAVVLPVTAARYQREEVIPALEAAAGLDLCLCHGRLFVGAGYEAHYWFNLGSSYVEAVAQPQVTKPNNISLDGFYFRAIWLW